MQTGKKKFYDAVANLWVFFDSGLEGKEKDPAYRNGESGITLSISSFLNYGHMAEKLGIEGEQGEKLRNQLEGLVAGAFSLGLVTGQDFRFNEDWIRESMQAVRDVIREKGLLSHIIPKGGLTGPEERMT